jgi:peptidoglycan/xylan/chitin deacetylase (PgdA/CDA1 family)
MELNKGIFVMSLDTELAWGTIDKPKSYQKNLEYYKKTRKIIDKLLNLFEKYEISATWAIVGHLFLKECSKSKEDIKHPEIIRPKTFWYEEDWFCLDPATNIEQDPCWYGLDIVEKIKNCKVKQEIGSHSFSHMIFSNPELTEEAANSDIKKCIELANLLNLDLKSFVFPRNEEGFYNILKNNNFVCYRGKEKSWYEKYPKKLQKIFHIIDQTFAIKPKVHTPKENEGLYNIPASMLYLSRDSFRKFIPIKSREIKAKKGIDDAIKHKMIFHLWFHPFNLATDEVKLFKGLENILKYVDKKRSENLLEVKTMSQCVESELTQI